MATTDSGTETLFSDESPPPPLDCKSTNTAAAGKPPNIQPFSGVLEKGKCVIRPIAFKPSPSATSRFSRTGERYGSTPILTRPGSRLTVHGSTSDLCHTSLKPTTLRTSCQSLSVSPSLSKLHCDSIGFRRSSRGSLLDLTPSPSDSGVSELEAALRDRDSELAHLRQTMERNEQVIVRVYQEKERCWEREIRRLRNLHEQSMRASAQKVCRMEQMLMMHDYQHQQEKRRLAAETQRASAQSEHLVQELCSLRERLEETEWNLCQKTGEISLLKRQLKEIQNGQTTKAHDLMQVRNECKEIKEQLVERNRLVGELKHSLAMKESGREQLLELRKELDERQDAFERERTIWAQEKEKVLRYQRQLQMNYVQMYRRTRALETDVERLSLELQVGSTKITASSSSTTIEL